MKQRCDTFVLADQADADWRDYPHLHLAFGDLGEYRQAVFQAHLETTQQFGRELKSKATREGHTRALALSRLKLLRNPFSAGFEHHAFHRQANRITLWIYGGIGDKGILAEQLCKQLAENEDAQSIVIRVASAGGFLDESLAIAEAIVNHPARSVAIVDRYAMSGGSLIASAANRVLVRRDSTWMAHQSVRWLSGNADDFAQASNNMRCGDQRLSDMYARRRKVSKYDLYQLLKSGRHLTAQEAVEIGVADAVIHELPIEWSKAEVTQ